MAKARRSRETAYDDGDVMLNGKFAAEHGLKIGDRVQLSVVGNVTQERVRIAASGRWVLTLVLKVDTAFDVSVLGRTTEGLDL